MTNEYKRSIIGVPPFMFTQAVRQWLKVMFMLLRHEEGVVRQAMNGTHAIGMIVGRINRWMNGYSA